MPTYYKGRVVFRYGGRFVVEAEDKEEAEKKLLVSAQSYLKRGGYRSDEEVKNMMKNAEVVEVHSEGDSEQNVKAVRQRRIENLRQLLADVRDAESSFEQSALDTAEETVKELLDKLLLKDDVSSQKWDEFHSAMDKLKTHRKEEKTFNAAEEKYVNARNKLLGCT